MAFDKENYVPEETKSGRVIGSREPISIGTAIALETITIEEPEFEVLMINVYTLFRNFWGSWNNSNRPSLTVTFPEWLEELETIKALVASMGVHIVFYKPDYSKVQGFWPDAKVRLPKTTNQKLYANAERIAINAIAKQTELVLHGTGLFMPIVDANVFLLSHQPIDLLSITKYDSIALLESHTAEIKSFGEYHTKINTTNPRIGFNHLSMLIFGDKSKLFNGMSNKFKMAYEKVAEERKWNHGTSYDKIYSDINNYVEKDLKDVLLRVLRKKPSIPPKIKVEK